MGNVSLVVPLARLFLLDVLCHACFLFSAGLHSGTDSKKELQCILEFTCSQRTITMALDTLRLCTWNIKGSHSPIKRKKNLQALRKEKVDIAMLQETHLNEEEHLKLQQCGFDQVYFSSFTSKSRGVAILFRKNLPVKVSKCVQDKYGRFVLVLASLNAHQFALLNVYYPPCHPLNFLTEAFTMLSDFAVENTVIAGDFNCLMNPLIDKLPASNSLPSKRSNQITGLCEDFGYVDAWRSLHPVEKEFTFFF